MKTFYCNSCNYFRVRYLIKSGINMTRYQKQGNKASRAVCQWLDVDFSSEKALYFVYDIQQIFI